MKYYFQKKAKESDEWDDIPLLEVAEFDKINNAREYAKNLSHKGYNGEVRMTDNEQLLNGLYFYPYGI